MICNLTQIHDPIHIPSSPGPRGPRNVVHLAALGMCDFLALFASHGFAALVLRACVHTEGILFSWVRSPWSDDSQTLQLRRGFRAEAPISPPFFVVSRSTCTRRQGPRVTGFTAKTPPRRRPGARSALTLSPSSSATQAAVRISTRRFPRNPTPASLPCSH